MAKQSFSVGQVLTAAQMTSLQQTAMLGGSTTAKTTSYTLVAADAGTVVSVNSTSATTITVNTGLFSAGDTVTIQNWGSGAVTITAGTATVNTAGSLIVPQYDGGVLYFTSASAAIYFDFVQAGAVSPLTTKGDLYTFGSSDTRLGVGANNTVLTADSAEATGLKWATPAGGGGTWQDYTPSYTNFTPGNATITARYSQTGKVVTVFFSCTFGSTSSISGTPGVSLPANTVAGFNEMVVVFGKVEDVGTSFLVGGALIVHSTQTFRWQYFPTNANDLTSANISSTAPFTWVTGDKFATTFTYEAA